MLASQIPSIACISNHQTGFGHSLVQQFETRLAHTYFLLNAKLWNSWVFRWTFSTENLATGTTMVLKTPREQIQVNFSAWADKLSHAVATKGSEARNLWASYFQESPTHLSCHNSKLDPAPVTLLCINPVWGLCKEKHMILYTQKLKFQHFCCMTWLWFQIFPCRASVERDKCLNSLFQLQTWHHSP